MKENDVFQMNDSEICTSYRQAKNKNEQVKILAQLNAVPNEKILEILSENGYITGTPAAKNLCAKEIPAEKKSVKKRENPNVVSERYIGLADKGFTVAEAAEALGIAADSVYRYAKNHGIRFADMREKRKAAPTAGTVETAKPKEKIVLSKDSTICEEKQAKFRVVENLTRTARKSVLEIVGGGEAISFVAGEKRLILTVKCGEKIYSVSVEGVSKQK